MKLFRFMSKKEFIKYMNGETLVNTTDHNRDNNKMTNSVGFCFFNYVNYKPEEMLHSVTGITSISICCVFETQRKYVRKTMGRYMKTVDKEKMLRKSFIADEYCTTEYSKERFKLIKYTSPDWFNEDNWKWKEIQFEKHVLIEGGN